MCIVCPVMKLAASETKNSTRFAMSSGVPIRPIGATTVGPRVFSVIGDLMRAGAIAFTFMPYFASSAAALFVKATTPAFDAE